MDDRGICVFGRLSREQAERLAEMFDEGLLLRRPNFEQMRRVTGPSFTDGDLADLARLYLDLLMTKINEAARRDVESGAGLDADKRDLLATIAGKMRDAADADKMMDNLTLTAMDTHGHPHIGSLAVYTELRPLFLGGTVRRLVPRMVVELALHEGGRVVDRPVRFQMSLADARDILGAMQTGIDELKVTIESMRGKFGDDVVHA